MKSSPITLSIEIGGQDLLVHGTYTPEDPGQTSGPPEKCWPPEDAELEVTKVELQTWITDDLAPGKQHSRQVLVDITDLINECGGSDLVQEKAEKAAEDWEAEYEGPEETLEYDE